MNTHLTESDIEQDALDILKSLGYEYVHGPHIAPDGETPERKSYGDVILIDRLRQAIKRINPSIPEDAREEAIKKLLRSDSPSLIKNNERFHDFLLNGIDVSYRKGRIIHDSVKLADFTNPNNNEFLAVNQFTVTENNNTRRPDIVLFINGIPITVIELKNMFDEEATIWSAYDQLETYKSQIPSLFNFNEILVISDGLLAKAGTLTSSKERFQAWKLLDSKTVIDYHLDTLLNGMFNKNTLLDLIHHFITFEHDKKSVSKKLSAYHQFNAVNKAVKSTFKAITNDHRIGVVWHTQGSGKSLTMAFYAGKIISELDNPTIVVLTDRNDLDDQLFEVFGKSNKLLKQIPAQVKSRSDLKDLLKVASGGVIFTTIQKFFPEKKDEKHPLLSDRKNIIMIADEAHRSQYDFIDGYAKHMRDALPNASFIGFTGTPIEKTDKNTRAVFGDYIDVYDIEQAVEDEATVKIYYENRLVKLSLKESEKPKLDPQFEEITEGEESSRKELIKSKWARLEAIVGSEKRIKQIAKDLVNHFESRLSVSDGKGMIVCMSRRICVDLYNQIVKLRPNWATNDDSTGFLKVMMTGSASDPKDWQQHIRTKARRKDLADRMKDNSDPLKLVIVRDMWLTGFDVPSMHTMYVDKPMQGHGLMQAIARVNRVFKDKTGGLVVDYLGIADELGKAVSIYTDGGGNGKLYSSQEEAVNFMLEKYEIVKALFDGFDYGKFFNILQSQKKQFFMDALNWVLKQKDGSERFIKNVTELLRAFALAVPHESAIEIRDEVGFFQGVKSLLSKVTSSRKPDEMFDTAIKQLISKAIVSDDVVDIFSTAGIKKPDISILSEDFLSSVKGMKQKNLALELLKKLINNQIKIISRKNLVQSRNFSELLEQSIKRYQNRSVEAAQVLNELIELAKQMKDVAKREKALGLSSEEVAFFDALAAHDHALQVMGDGLLKTIAREVVDAIRQNTSVDWTVKESVQAKLRTIVKRILRKHGYPPDQQAVATDLVLEQAKLLCADWSC